VERFRKTLVMLGEPNPDALIAERLSGEAPFTSTDLFATPEPTPTDAPAETGEAESDDDALRDLIAAARVADDEPVVKKGHRSRPADEERHFELSANAIDLDSILGDLESPSPTAHADSDDVEIDLSVLDDADPDESPTEREPEPEPEPEEPHDLDGVFGNLREEASHRSGGLDDAEKEYKRGQALRDAGDVEGAIQALEQASRAPRLRFVTASLIGRLYRDRGMMVEALEWFERAAQAPAPTSDDSNQLLYELADCLEQVGELARALAISLELEAEAGEYRDIKERIERLTKVQARG
jgi:tetratricopeptide (TPR) repeat protein